MYYFRGFHQTPESENPIKFLFKAAIITLVTVSFLSLEEKLREYDTILCIIGGIALIIYIFWIIRNYRKNKIKLRDVVFFDPPKYYTAAEVAVLDKWWSTWKVFPAMLYERISNKNVKLWMDDNWELFFEKLREEPILAFDDNFSMMWYDAYNKDPEHDFWALCFPNRNRVYLRMISTLPDLERLPSDFFYKAQRDTTSRYDYKHNRRNISSVTNEVYLLTWISFFLFYFSFALLWRLPLILSGACILRIIDIKLKFSIWSKKYLTQHGVQVLEQIKWFKKYLLAVEDAKLKVTLDQDPLYFEKILPYAIALGIWDTWADKCFKHFEYNRFWELVTEKLYNDSKTSHHVFEWLDDLPSFVKFLNHYYKNKKKEGNANWKKNKFCDESIKFIHSLHENNRNKKH